MKSMYTRERLRASLRSLICAAVAFTTLVPLATAQTSAQIHEDGSAFASVKTLSNGFELNRGDHSIRVTAVNPWVFRVQISPSSIIADNHGPVSLLLE